ncbi:hypothetical protein M569_14908, partial [Genlisea aurea]
VICYAPTMIATNGIWVGENPLDYSLPLFILQLILVVLTTRFFVFLFKPLKQPRVISEILGGIILGPSVLGRSKKFADTIFPLRSLMILETMANVGLLYFLFLVGVEMDIGVIRRTGKRAFTIALSGMILPFVIGSSFAFLIHSDSEIVPLGTFILFLGVALSVTAFPVLARILAELKLLNTEIGRIAMSSALINDMCAWILLAVAIALAENESMSLASVWVILSSAAFVVLCIYVIKPLIAWMVTTTTHDGGESSSSITDLHICIILTGVMISGFITDAIGTHSVFGAFIFGLIIPDGSLGVALIEKLEDFVSGILLPLFFAISGLKTDISAIGGVWTWLALVLLMILSCAGKIVGTLLISTYYKMLLPEGLALGLLMNTKGLVEMIVLNVGRDQRVLDDKAFAIMVVVAVVMTSVISPVVMTIYNPAKKKSLSTYKRRTILQAETEEEELRVLVCIHHPRNVPTIISLLEASNPTNRSPISVYALHMVELTGRDSAVIIVHSRHHNAAFNNRNRMQVQAQSDTIISAFESFANRVPFVSVQPLTAVSPYSTVHEDVSNVAEEQRAAFVIIPFHKQQTVDGGMEELNPAYRLINRNVLDTAPCSVGILVDRGLNLNLSLSRSGGIPARNSYRVMVLFFGGADDREALSYAWRMSESENTRVTVARFLAGQGGQISSQADDEYIDFYMSKSHNNNTSYCEKFLNHGEETVAAIREMVALTDLFIVGRGYGMESPLLAGITDWSECPELGPIGDLLASSDFAATSSVLVVQQY